jgi:hypothetical protein
MDQPHTTYWTDLTQNDVLYLLVHLPPLQNPRSEPLNRLIRALMNHPVLASAEDPDIELLSPSSPEPMIIDSPPTASMTAIASVASTASIAAATSQTVDNSARGDARVSRITDKGKSKEKTPKESKKSKKKQTSEFHFISLVSFTTLHFLSR